MLTFLEVGFGGNLVQGFRVYAWRAVPSFPQIALCALEMQSDPSPLESRTSLTLADISKDISNLRPQENNTSSFNYFQLEHLLDSDSEFVALLRLEVRSQCPNWPMSMDYLSCPNKYQATPSGDCGFSFVSFRCGHIPAVTVRCDRTTKTKRQTRYRCLWGTPWGTLFTANAFPFYIVFCIFLVFCGFSQNHSNCSKPD